MNPQQTLRESAALPLLVFALMLAWGAGWALGPRGAAASAEAARQRGPQEPEDEEPTSEVYGRAVYEATGRPVRRARVLLMDVEGGASFRGLTDARGEFRIRGVAAGRYVALVDLPGLVTPHAFVSLEERRGGSLFDGGEVEKSFDVVAVDGRADREVTVRARRGAALGGRVTYADGSPAVGAQVHVMRRRGGRLQRVMVGAGQATTAGGRTDDRGMFRAAGLPPGEYVVAVSEAATHGDADSSQVSEYETGQLPALGLLSQPLLMTFYPSAASADDSTAVTVRPGDEREDLDIVIPERELRTLSGAVRGRRDGRPVAGAQVTILRKGENPGLASGVYIPYGVSRPNTTHTDEQGRWRLSEIPDGSYTLYVNPKDEDDEREEPETRADGNLSFNRNMSRPRAAPPRPKKHYAPARRDVEVAAGTAELVFELREGGHISGAVTIEGAKELPQGSYVYAVREGKEGADEYHHASVVEGQFAFAGLPPGEYSLHYGSYNTYEHKGPRPYVKSMTWEGRDLLRERLAVGEGGAAERVRVVLSADVATLRVRVLAEGKTPVRGIHVFLMKAAPEGWSRHQQSLYCTTDTAGLCEIGAPPGEYAAVALPRRLSTLDDLEAEMKKRGPAAPRAALRAGETREIELAAPPPRQ